MLTDKPIIEKVVKALEEYSVSQKSYFVVDPVIVSWTSLASSFGHSYDSQYSRGQDFVTGPAQWRDARTGVSQRDEDGGSID
jgi:hypothetical protein